MPSQPDGRTDDPGDNNIPLPPRGGGYEYFMLVNTMLKMESDIQRADHVTVAALLMNKSNYHAVSFYYPPPRSGRGI